MGNALYRKYRSQTLDEIVGQNHITATLKNALAQGKISHAYLLTGPRGVGKTSVARIIAREVNGFAHEEEETHLDIIEIDAASNRRIDEVRDLREKVHTAPSVGKYKVYIIDEVHMLTKEAFNALLKTLEEPPAHVIFILATTELHKLPDTIVSRTQRYSFQAIDVDTMINHLTAIAKKENIKITDAALMQLADYAEGSFRDALSLLDQVQHMVTEGETVTEEIVSELLGIPPVSMVNHVIDYIEQGDIASLQRVFADMQAQGLDSGKLVQSLIKHLRQDIANAKQPLDTIALMKRLTNVQASTQPRLMVELTLYEAAFSNVRHDEQQGISDNTDTRSHQLKATKPPKGNVKTQQLRKSNDTVAQKKATDSALTSKAHQQAAKKPSKPATVSDSTDVDALELWPKVLEALKGSHNTLYGMARVVSTGPINGDTLTLYCKFPFHAKRLADTAHKKILEETIQSISGRLLSISCEVQKRSKEASDDDRGGVASVSAGAKKAESHHLETVSNIFGSAEVIES